MTHNLGGGVERHVADLQALLSGVLETEILRAFDATTVSLEMVETEPAFWRFQDWGQIVEALRLRQYDWISIEHIHGFPPQILALATELGLPYDLTAHDFYPFCPIYSLSTISGEYCGEPDLRGCAKCTRERPNAWNWSIARWRREMGVFLAGASRIIAPTRFVADRMRRHFPDIQALVWPHPTRVEWIKPVVPTRKILLIGKLTRMKGLDRLLACARRALEKKLGLVFCVLGSVEHALPTAQSLPIQVRGEYADEDLPQLIASERADAIWFPGPYPETYCYTLDAALATGLPIVASNFGAIAERLQGHPGARLVAMDAESRAWCDALLEAANLPHQRLLDQPEDPALHMRSEYGKKFAAPILARPAVQKSLPDKVVVPAGIDRLLQPPATADLPVSFLFEQGVECGQREARLALKSRLTEIESDYAVLDGYTQREGMPWFEVLNQTAMKSGLLALRESENNDLRGDLQTLRSDTDVLRNEAQGQRNEVQVLRSEAQVLRSEGQTLRNDNIILRNETDMLRSEATVLRNEAGVLRSEATVLRNDTDLQRQQLMELAQNIADRDSALQVRANEITRNAAELARAVGRIKELEASTSWRVTAPLRVLGQFGKQLKYKMRRVNDLASHTATRAPLAWKILRSDGFGALVQRLRTKVGARQFIPTAEYQTALAPIGKLVLATCAVDKLPRVSIVIPVYEHDDHTFNCLVSIAAQTRLDDVEIIVVDDASPVPVTQALGGVSGVTFLRAAQNAGFIESCERGGERARGEFLVLLNNDVQVTAGWLNNLLAVFRTRADAGLVGARLVYPDGRLQEAGGIVWQDGSAWNWGRGDDPDRPQYQYLRAVDYCSGACLAIRMTDWRQLGGFDKRYAPAYYEDTDLAFRVRQLGKKVYYQPASTIVHFEGVSSGTDESAGIKRHQLINRATFLTRWEPVLKLHSANGHLPQREADRGAKARVLVVEACMITPDQDAGSVRMLAMLELMVELGCKVSFIADNIECREPYVGQLRQAGIEVWHHPYVESVAQLLSERGRDFDVIMFCRHYIAARYLSDVRNWAPQAKIVFDTVDLHYLREQRLARLDGSKALLESAEATRQQELGAISGSDMTLVVSDVEQELLARELPSAAVEIVTIIHETRQAAQQFGERSGLLFVGGFRHPPNVDAVNWFVDEVWPLIHQRQPDITFTIVGSNMPSAISELKAPNVVVAGFVQKMDPLLDTARISIAPLRYGAGVKGKVNQAMACGLPVVATSVAAEGMNLKDGEDLLIADSPQAFADAVIRLYNDKNLWDHLVEGGKRSIEANFSRTRAKRTLAALVGVEEPKIHPSVTK